LMARVSTADHCGLVAVLFAPTFETSQVVCAVAAAASAADRLLIVWAVSVLEARSG